MAPYNSENDNEYKNLRYSGGGDCENRLLHNGGQSHRSPILTIPSNLLTWKGDEAMETKYTAVDYLVWAALVAFVGVIGTYVFTLTTEIAKVL